MSTLVESLRRLYIAGSAVVTLQKLDGMLISGKITQAEYDYIITP
jgi:hypothetical protein